MSVRLLLLIIASVGLSALAQLALKMGTAAARGSRGGPLGEVVGLLSSPMVLVGLCVYGLGAILWILVLARTELSVAYPFVGLGFILTMLAGVFVLQEPVGALRVAGTILIAAGCVMVARSA